jgi:hypothetical protein
MMRRVVAFCLAACLATPPLEAEPSQTDQTLAQSLFDQAKALMAAGNYDEACPKLEESERLDSSGGTLMNLADCHEQRGKVASAWNVFKHALSVAKKEEHQERIAVAEERIRALEPKLPWLTVSVSSAVEGQEVKLDGALVGRAAWGTSVAIDPGVHELSATAPGTEPWSQRVEITIAEQKTVTIPALGPAVPERTTSLRAPPVAKPASDWRQQSETSRMEDGGSDVSFAWLVLGGSSIALGTLAGLSAMEKHEESNDLCPTDTTCTKEGAELEKEANTAAWVSNIAFGLGIVAVSIGLFAGGGGSREANARSTRRLALEADADTKGGRVNLKGSF